MCHPCPLHGAGANACARTRGENVSLSFFPPSFNPHLFIILIFLILIYLLFLFFLVLTYLLFLFFWPPVQCEADSLPRD